MGANVEQLVSFNRSKDVSANVQQFQEYLSHYYSSINSTLRFIPDAFSACTHGVQLFVLYAVNREKHGIFKSLGSRDKGRSVEDLLVGQFFEENSVLGSILVRDQTKRILYE